MRAPSRLGAFQARAESLMTLTLTAYSPNGTTPDADGFEVLAFTPEGVVKGYVPREKERGGETQYVDIGGVKRPIRREGLSLPSASFVHPTTGRVEILAGEQRGLGWEFVVDEIGAHDNPALRGVRFLIVGISLNSLTACRLDVVEV